MFVSQDSGEFTLKCVSWIRDVWIWNHKKQCSQFRKSESILYFVKPYVELNCKSHWRYHLETQKVTAGTEIILKWKVAKNAERNKLQWTNLPNKTACSIHSHTGGITSLGTWKLMASVKRKCGVRSFLRKLSGFPLSLAFTALHIELGKTKCTWLWARPGAKYDKQTCNKSIHQLGS